MSDFNNYPNGYQQNNQQPMGGYGQPNNQPMGGYGQANNQPMGGYGQPVAQQSMGGYGQPNNQQMGGYGQPNNQQMGGYGQMNPQQPMGGYGYPNAGKPPKKSHAGLIVGIIVAILAVAGLVVFLLRDKIFAPKIAGGYDSPEQVVKEFFISFTEQDREHMKKCFMEESTTYQSDVDNNIQQAGVIMAYSTLNTAGITVTTSDFSDTQTLKNNGYEKMKDAKSVHIEVPMTQTVYGITYEVMDIYDGVVVQMKNNKWYIAGLKEVDAQIISTDAPVYDDSDDIIDDADDDDDVSDDSIDFDDIFGDDTDTDDTHTVAAGFKTMGDATNGYVDVPEDWVPFEEAGGISGVDSHVQFSTADQKAIITLCVYDSDATAEEVAPSLEEGLKEDAEDVSMSAAVLSGYTGYQLRAYYPEDETWLIIWVFRAPGKDNYLHYVAVEYTPEYAAAEGYMTGSYRLGD